MGSGTFPRDQVFALGGYLSPAVRWGGFNKEWSAVLRDAIPIRRFKSFDADNFAGEFDRGRCWNKALRDGKVERLCEVIGRRADASILCSVERSLFMRGTVTLPQKFRDPYYLCYLLILNAMPELLRRRGYFSKATVDLVFDIQRDGHGNAMAHDLCREKIRRERKTWLNRIISSTDDVDIAIQSSDLLAYRSRRFLAGRNREIRAIRYAKVGGIYVLGCRATQQTVRDYVGAVTSRKDLW